MLKQKERVMDAEKMLSVVRAYRSLLSFIPPLSGPFDKPPTPRKALAHTAGMLDKIEAFVKEGTPEAWDKANRWLGFLQGVFWVQGIYTLDQMRDHNRDGIKPGRPAAPISEPPDLVERLDRHAV